MIDSSRSMVSHHVVQIGEKLMIGGEEHLQLRLPAFPQIQQQLVAGQLVERPMKGHMGVDRRGRIVVVRTESHVFQRPGDLDPCGSA